MASYYVDRGGIGLNKEYQTAERLLTDLGNAVEAVFKKENPIDVLTINSVNRMKQYMPLLKLTLDCYEKSSRPSDAASDATYEVGNAMTSFYNVMNHVQLRLAGFYSILPADVKEKLEPSSRAGLEVLVKGIKELKKRPKLRLKTA